MANCEKKKFDLEKIHEEAIDAISVAETIEDSAVETEKFNALLDAHDRYLDTLQKEMRRKPVDKGKEIVADADAIQETLKTYSMINKKLQQQIKDGIELSPNDIKLLVSMMTALNGGG